MALITVAKMAAEMGLRNLTPDIDAEEKKITKADINRPALAITGFFEYFDNERVQILGKVETAYLATLLPEVRRTTLHRLFETHIPCLIFCRGPMPDEDTLALARRHDTPILGTQTATTEMANRLNHYLQKWLSPTITIHGELIDVLGEGVLLTGESGIGKSEAALELIKRGHRLVADDAVELRKVDEETLIGCAPEITKDFVELRGVGIIDVKTLFGVQSVKNEQKVDMEIHLEDWNRDKVYDRLGNKDEYSEYLGVRVLRYALPLRPGRNLAVIIEAIAVNYRQRTMGYQAVDLLYKRVQENLMKNTN